MKISILTFHNVPNFGAFLQVYALSKFLKSKGHHVDVIDLELIPPRVSQAGRIINRINDSKFSSYRRKYLSLTKKITDFSELEDYDLYVVGSDQVWNKDITGSNFLKYFFEGIDNSKKMISYAASFGKNEWIYDGKETEQIHALIKRFEGVSVRERTAAEFCAEHLSVSAKIVVDPTLLWNNYEELVVPKTVAENQIVCFKFKRDKAFYDFVKQLKIQDREIVELRGLFPHRGTKNIPFPSVGSWLGYIKNAPYVLTDSFHGVCMSLMFRKNFIVIPADLTKFNRIENILSQLGLEGRIFRSYEEILSDRRWEKPIDYTKVNGLLVELREESSNFLMHHLK